MLKETKISLENITWKKNMLYKRTIIKRKCSWKLNMDGGNKFSRGLEVPYKNWIKSDLDPHFTALLGEA